MRKESALTLFYVAYFFWLFAVVFLTRFQEILGYFVVIVLVFYFLFLRDKWDILLFFATISVYYLYRIVSFDDSSLSYNLQMLSEIPLWLPLSWGTTTLALKKFYKLATKSI